MPDDQTCSSCRAFLVDSAGQGTCHHFPPTVVRMPPVTGDVSDYGHVKALFPEVAPLDWCMQWQHY